MNRVAHRSLGRRGTTIATATLTALALVSATQGTAWAAKGGKPKTRQAGASFLTKKYAGSTITVLLPPWGQMPKSQLAKFTKATGIKVNLESLAWDSIHDKVVTSEAANVSPYDVGEVDWSWVGQFGAAGWYTPLNRLLPHSVIAGSPMSPAFVYKGKQIAMPYLMDFRGTVLNMTYFRKAGITKAPTTWAQLLADAKQIKAKGIVQYPVGIPLSVTEGTSTPWYVLIKSTGTELLNPKTGAPTFKSLSSPGGQALLFEQEIYKDGLVPPGEISLTDVQTNSLFQAGKIAVVLSASPGGLAATFKDPSVSKVAKDDIAFIPFPGNDGHATGTFELPEGLGIPKLSTHKAQAAMFIYWWEQLPQQLLEYNNPNLGDLPSQTAAIKTLVAQGKLYDGKTVLNILPSVRPLFPEGAPVWYPQFSTDVATMIQNVVEGKSKPEAALSQLASQVESLEKQTHEF
ncbi:MAG: sugar ABC transporter substrate-binding protein [Actinomycetota bacterium]|nr:sugar ABC transporter substrate-binding protein [Actinomycetota bacterium]